MLLYEAFDKPYKVRLKGHNFKDTTQWIGEFNSSNGDEYRINIEKDNIWNKPWSVLFWNKDAGLDKATGLVGKGDQYRIFATVMYVLKKFIKKEQPNIFTFEALEKNRASLYEKMIEKYAGVLGYKLSSKSPSHHGILYIMTRK